MSRRFARHGNCAIIGARHSQVSQLQPDLGHPLLKLGFIRRLEGVGTPGSRNIGETRGTPREKKARRLLYGIPCRVLQAAALERALEVGYTLKSKGEGIGPNDTITAGLALHHDDTILTGNRAHFERVPGLKIDPASL